METKTGVLAFTAAALLLVSVGCEHSELEGMEGRWRGTIVCYSGEAELTTHFTREGDVLVGTAQTRYKENNKSWKTRMTAAKSCQEDTCTTDRDCPLGFSTGDAHAGELRRCIVNPKCAKRCAVGDATTKGCDPCDACSPCQICDDCRSDWLPFMMSLEDDEVVTADPELKLWRIGGGFLKGSITGYCPNPTALHPVVELHQD